MPDNKKPNNINSDITPKPLGVNQVNPDTGISDTTRSNTINNIPGNTSPVNNFGTTRRQSPTLDNINRLNNSPQKTTPQGTPTDPNDININNNQFTDKPPPPTPKPEDTIPKLEPLIPNRPQLTTRPAPEQQPAAATPQPIPQPTRLLPPQPQPVTGPVNVAQKLIEKNKEKMMIFLAKLTAWLSGAIISAVIWMIITVFMLAILGALALFILDNSCTALKDAPFGGAGLIPDNVKKICEYYTKLKGGCFSSPSEEQKKADLPVLECIGKGFKDGGETVYLNDAKGKSNVKKQVIREIIKAGKSVGVTNETIFYAIAVHALVSGGNDFKETSAQCLGIAQFCSDGKSDSAWALATKGLNINPENYIPSDPATQDKARGYQLKSIQNFITARKDVLDKSSKNYAPPACVKEKTESKDIDYAIAYTWTNLQCDTTSPISLSREQFAERVKANLLAINCPEFITNIAYVDLFAYEDRPYIQFIEQLALIRKKEENQKEFMVVEAKSAETISTEMCNKLKEYRPFLDEAAKTFANPLFPISNFLMGGMLLQESRVGLAKGEQIPLGCGGTGDRSNGQSNSMQGAGHGLSQADATSGDAYENGRKLGGLEDQWSQNVILKPKFISETVKKAFDTTKIGPYKWFDCRESILYGAAHHIYLAELVQCKGGKSSGCGNIDDKFTGWGLNIEKEANGKYKDFKTQKAFVQLAIDANNAGQGLYSQKTGKYCTANSSGEVNDACSADGFYGKQVFEYALQVAKCFGVNTTIDDMIKNPGTGGTGGGGSTCDSGSINAQGAEFPLLSKKGVKIYFGQPYPEYIGGGKHDGIDLTSVPTDPQNTAAASVSDGEVLLVGGIRSISINGGDPCSPSQGYAACTKVQGFVTVAEAGTGKTFTYIHLDQASIKVKKGDKVTKGQVIGQLDNFKFVHLHFEVKLNGVLQQPTQHIKGWNSALEASTTRAPTSLIDVALTEKLQ